MLKTTIWSVVLAIVLWWSTLQMPVQAEPEPYSRQTQFFDDPPLTETVKSRFDVIPRLEIAKIRSGVLPGVVIGGHYEGLLKILQKRYTAAGELDEQFEDSARYLIEDELSQAGFDVLRSRPNSIFDEQLSDDIEPGKFLIGGTITQVRLNSYSSWWGDVTQDERTIRWEVFDRDRLKVIYRKEITSSAQAEGVNNPAASYDAIRASLKTLLAEPAFIARLQQPAASSIAASSMSYEIAAIAGASEPLSIEQIAGRSIPSVVRIRTPLGRGSGFLLDSSGLVVTNEHVVESAFSVKVDFYDGSTRIGRILKRDPALDAALVKLDGGAIDIPALPVCHTDAVRVGESVVAIGNPLSLSNSVTQGIVSGFRGGAARGLIQTDTAINPGNSGGPLLNRRGVVIGIVTEKVASKGIEGLGFALPIGEVLQRLKVRVALPRDGQIDACGSALSAERNSAGTTAQVPQESTRELT